MIGTVRFKVALIGAGTAVALGLGPVHAGEVDDLKAKVETLQKRLGKLEAAKKKAKGGTSVSLSGYVKGDFYYDSHSDLGSSFSASEVLLEDEAVPGDDEGSFALHARQSRFRLGTKTSTSFGALKTLIETDFYGSGNVLRLRHAYGQLGPVLAGQAWSVLVDEDTSASTVDFSGPVGTVVFRRPQLRLSIDGGQGFVGQLALENAFKGNELPTLLGAVRYRADWGAVNLTGAIGRVDQDGQNLTAHALHGGVHVNAGDATKVLATLNLTNGVGLIAGGGAGAVLNAAGGLEAQQTLGGIAGISHRWTDSIRTGLYYGWVRNDTGDGVALQDAAETNKTVNTLHANVFWSPVPRANIGLELIHGWRQINPKVVKNAAEKYVIDKSKAKKGHATRVQVGVQYKF